MSVKAIIFDMDGVIIDSEGFWQEAQIGVLSRLGVTITSEECETLTKGKRIDEIARVWIHRHQLMADPVRLETAIINQVCQAIRAKGRAMSGLYQALRYFCATGCRLALATSSSPQIIEATFDKLQLWPWFEVICSAANEAHGKPHPDVYLSALSQLGLKAGECRVIEDSLSGFTAAQRASIKTWVVAPDCKAEKFSKACGCFQSLPLLIESLEQADSRVV